MEVVESEAEAVKRSSRVSFGEGAEEKTGSEWSRVGGPTPHAKKIPNEMFFDEDGAEVSVAEASAKAEAPPTEAPVDEPPARVPAELAPEVSAVVTAATQPSSSEASTAPAADASPVDVPATETPVAQVGFYKSSTAEVAAEDAPATAPASTTDTQAAEAPAAEDAPPVTQKIGVTGSPSAADAGKADNTFEESYEEDFADDTQNSMSKAITSGAEESGTFEASFEDGKG